MVLAAVEKTLSAFEPTNRRVPMTTTRIAASITAYSAMSCPSLHDQNVSSLFNIKTSEHR